MSDNSNLWGERANQNPSEAATALSRSIQFDWRLAKYEVLSTRAHILALKAAGYLTEPELSRIDKSLIELDKRVASGMFQPKPIDHDVHSALERGLIEMIGPDLGGKILSGRSRNDQAAAIIRLYLIDQSELIKTQVLSLIDVLATLAHEHLSEPMPGRTHFQHAQPVLLSHHLLAHVWPLVRDLERLGEWKNRASFSPYGAGDLAGTSLALDPNIVSEALGLTAPMANSIDATSSRDVVAEFAFIGSMIAVNLSRFAEEIVIWASPEFNYVKIADSYSTGSSTMPLKRNPDVAELTRAKAGRIIGDLTGLLATLKGLPLAYNRDLQEDKEQVFDIVDNLLLVLPAFTGMVSTLEFNVSRMEELASAGYSLASDVAEWLIRNKVSFREAHEITGKLVAFAESRDLSLDELSDAELIAISPALTPEVREVLSITGSIKARSGAGGTSVARVLDQISALRRLVPSGNR
ncbi:MAG: argininosuccinate lyase [Micrococcales bacterium]|nr:argininosuccinate lyase [Micrococcales bacterium]NBR54933.1 argininosuccinate lyase [Micrococcales bacterium]NBR61540.1 argininosuccinate lyase [Actinomycetota bacterium]NBT47391.1 argininosuccinate lyase [Actinomycetota bacterium]NBY44032.1 argininosuccinate lyase [Micrococcales bacterium]